MSLLDAGRRSAHARTSGFSLFWTQADVVLVHARTSRLGLFWTQADVALNAVRVPRPAGSSFTYRRRAPRRPASARVVGTRRKKCMGMGMGYWLLAIGSMHANRAGCR